jgi:Ion channel
MNLLTEERTLTALLVLILVDLFLLFPSGRGARLIEIASGLVFSLILLAGLLTMARHRALQVIFGVFVLLAVIIHTGRIIFGLPGLAGWDFLFSSLSLVGLLIVTLWMVYQEGPVTGHRIRGAIAAYLLLAVLFANAYGLINYLIPGAFNIPPVQYQTEQVEAFYYFSVVTLTTVGFGDITAVSPIARSFVMLEALIGQLYPAILIARLVSLQIETQRSGKGD